MRVLVTGGCGFLGGWVVRALVRRGHEVRILDARPDTAHLDFVEPGLPGRVEIRAGDVAVKDEVMRAAEDCGSAHLAGIMTVDCRRDPLRAANINLIGSLNLFEAALATGMRQVAYVSTAGVYGPDDGRHPRPMTHYGALKLAVEGCARAYSSTTDYAASVSGRTSSTGRERGQASAPGRASPAAPHSAARPPRSGSPAG